MEGVSYLGIVLIIVLFGLMLAAFYVVDRRLLNRIVRVLVYYLGSMALVGVYAWGILKFDRWWIALLGGIVVTMVTTYLSLLKCRLPFGRFFLPLFAAQILGMVVIVGSMILLVNASPIVTIVAVCGIAAGQMINSTGMAMKTYISSLKHTGEHYMYLLSNGATHVEAITPSVQRCLRASVMAILQRFTSPVFIAPPVFFCTLLLMGCAPLVAVLESCLLSFVVLAGCFLTAVLSLLFVDRIVFDRSGRFIL
jgi:putative ABC transport system permease protein